VYLRSDDAAELDTLLADTSLEQLGLRRIAPTVALSDLPADVVLARLRRAHRAPLLESTDGHAVEARAASRRARVRRQPALDTRGLDESQVRAIVSAVRAGEHARSKRPAGARRGGPSELVEQLRTAIDTGQTVWLVYLDETGTVSERVVDPLGVDGGRLSAYDHRSLRRRSFSLHRISRVAVAED
jgi:predicted DNA-binding transcriptional regulator YafY